jgi:hypothetical protein
MDANRFDSLTRSLSAAGSRRRALALAVSGALAPLVGLGETDARSKLKKSKKIDNKKRRKKCIKKAKGASNACQDKKKNGSESDIDCGGTCPRCAVGKTCNSRADCTSARCDGGTCTSCALNTDCGLDTDGNTCFCRPTEAGEKFCTRQLCKFFMGGTCADCLPGEQCLVAGAGADRECCIPCGG